MNLNEAIAQAQGIIEAGLKNFNRPAVLWSSGKDSMALLHLLLDRGLPVVHFRDPQHPGRYEFANGIIRDWKLEVHSWPPVASAVCQRDSHLSIIHRYQIGPGKTMDLPVDLVEGAGMVCGLKDVLHRPKASFISPWGLFFSGSRSADADPLLGHMPLAADIVHNENAPAFCFPFRSWSDAILWEYLESRNVPYQTDRYEKAAGGWGERQCKDGNPDYLPGCTRCMDLHGPGRVPCPILGLEVNNISRQLPRIEVTAVLPDYIEKEESHAV